MDQSKDNKTVKRIKDIAQVAVGDEDALSQNFTNPVSPIESSTSNLSRSVGVVDRAGIPKEFMTFFEHDSDEEILMQGARHPFGIYGIYAVTGLVLLVLGLIAGITLLESKAVLGATLPQTSQLAVSFVSILLALLTGIGGMLSAKVYAKSRMILTNKKLVVINYRNIFNRDVSQLNIVQVEDVNVSQPTLLHRLLKVGLITVETAGEEENNALNWIVNPYVFADATIQTHQKMIPKQ